MWTKTYSMVTTAVTKEQMWKLFADVNNWHLWDDGIEYARLEGAFEKGNYFMLKPKGAPRFKIKLVETIACRRFTDLTRFPLAEMYGDHRFEDTAAGLKISSTITVKGLLSFLWVKLIARKIADGMPGDIEKQIAYASTR